MLNEANKIKKDFIAINVLKKKKMFDEFEWNENK